MLSYRHHTKAFLRVFSILLVFASCINDDFTDDAISTRYGDDTPLYMSLQLKFDANASETRSGTNEFGSHEEHAVGKTGNYAILFDEQKNLFGVYPLYLSLADVKHQDNSGNSGYDNITDENGNIDKTKEGTYLRLLHVYPRNNKLPESCLVILNASNAISNKLEGYKNTTSSQTVESILKEIWSVDANTDPKTIGINVANGTRYFTMTNSIYIKSNGSKKDTVGIKYNIYPTIQEAIKHPAIVYVERMVSKFSFEEAKVSQNHIYPISQDKERILLFNGYDNSKTFPDDSDDPGTLKTVNITDYCEIELKGWGINALETQSHVFKNIENKDYFGNWNLPTFYRSCWSEDPHYGNSYPWQYRYAVEKKAVGYYSDPNNPSPLRNYSYSDFVNETSTQGEDRIIYTPENTYGEEVLSTDYDNRTNVLAGTHLILCAELKVDKNYKEAATDVDLTTVTPTADGERLPTNLYRDRTGVYYKTKKDCLAELIREFNYQLRSQAYMRYCYYKWNPQTNSNDGIVFTAKPTGNYQLCIDDNSIQDEKDEETGEAKAPANWNKSRVTWITYDYIKNLSEDEIDLPGATTLKGDGKLMPWLASKISNLTIRDKDTGKKLTYFGKDSQDKDYDYKLDEKYEKTSLGNVKDYRNKHWGGFVDEDHIKSMIYEWVGAIDHFQDGKMYYYAPVQHNADNNDIPDDEQKPGDYGVVRNHWYKFKLNNITYLGTPVDKPEEPIVPNRVKTNSQLNFEVEIINWHEIETTLPIL